MRLCPAVVKPCRASSWSVADAQTEGKHDAVEAEGFGGVVQCGEAQLLSRCVGAPLSS